MLDLFIPPNGETLFERFSLSHHDARNAVHEIRTEGRKRAKQLPERRDWTPLQRKWA